jgi:uncharacterized membrane protein YphA (DoxX/SURF4 family)
MRADRSLDLDALPYALGALGLGALALVYRDFALQWQPVPKGVQMREALAIVSGLLLVTGAGAAVWRDRRSPRWLLGGLYALWVLLLHVPAVAAKPDVGTLLGLAEILSLALAGLLLAARAPGSAWLVRLYGLCPIVFGISHFNYADFTAMMVPAWIPPNGLFWAYATGAAHLAAGLAILSGIQARLAATLLAAMCGLFVVLLHAPRVAAAPASRIEWTMIFVALSIAGGAWIVRRSLSAR